MAVWINGTLVADEQAAVSVFDHGLVTGDGVFETVKVARGVPFALTRHLERLARSADGLGLAPPAPDTLRDGIAAVLGAALLVLADLTSRTVVTPSELPIGIVTALAGAPFFLYLLLRQRNRYAP